MTVAAILAKDPHSKPASTDRSPAPFVHATDDSTEQEIRVAYRAFVDAFRAGAKRLRDRAREIRDMFPLSALPPQLPFKVQGSGLTTPRYYGVDKPARQAVKGRIRPTCDTNGKSAVPTP